MSTSRIGVVGGSGLYDIEGLTNVRTLEVSTPFGEPSGPYTIGELHGVELVFLPRHGHGHQFNPSEVNYRANIYGFKVLGVSWLIAVSAVGSLQDEIVPGEFVLVDQFIDRTHKRQHTFFTEGVVAHVPFAHPTCSKLGDLLAEAASEANVKCHKGGTYVNMEGPAFSTLAESKLYRSWGAQVIGMTALAEAKLAREAEMSYSVLAMATDYDCWHPTHDSVTVAQVIATVKKNVSNAKKVLSAVVPKLAALKEPSPYASALEGAIMTSPDHLPAQRVRELAPLIHKYVEIPPETVGNPAIMFGGALAATVIGYFAAKYLR
eukprot:m.59675 g.59675  ORF g.59675 m.59675 type:complete len:320 (+) comp13010_c0_seq2:111-1070(+)